MKTISDSYDYQRIAKALTYIQENFRQQPGLEEIAEHVHVSPHHFQRMFTAWAGISPKKYLKYISADFAKALMSGGNFSVGQVAYATGLSGTSRLHDLFVTLEAMTPGEYKSGGKSLEIRYGHYPSIFGTVLVASTPKGLCKLEFEQEPAEDPEFRLKQEWPGAKILSDQGSHESLVNRVLGPDLFDSTEGEIKLNVRATPFQVKVWEALLKIPGGEIASYNQIAQMIGQPKASRAVGSAIGRNPIAVLIPCHRVIKRTGGLSGYRWGPDRKHSILNWERCQLFRATV